MNKKRLLNLGLLLILVIVGVLYFNNPFEESDYDTWKEEVSYSDYAASVSLLQDSLDNKRNTYFDFLSEAEVDYSLPTYDTNLITPQSEERFNYEGDNVSAVLYGEEVTYSVAVDQAGYYNLDVDFYVAGEVLNNITLSVLINGEYQFDDARTVDVALYWEDAVDEYALDKYGDETLPAQRKIEEWRSLDLYNNTYTNYEPLLFYFEEGLNQITFENVSNGELYFGDVSITPPTYIPTYEEYLASNNYSEVEIEPLFINATDYVEKNSSYVRLTAYGSPSVAPYDSVNKKLNTIDGNAWYKAGQEVTYNVVVEESGLYDLTFHYANFKPDFNVFRSIKVNGEIPYRELASYQFENTDNDFKNETLTSDGERLLVYLEAGSQGNDITIRAEHSELAMYLKDIQLLIDHINQFALEIIKVTGKDIDQNRTWKLTDYIPETEAYLIAYNNIVKFMVVQMSEYSDVYDLSATLSYLKRTSVEFDRMLEIPDELPLYLNNLYSGETSCTLYLGDSLTSVMNQQLYLDGLYVGSDGDFGRENATFLSRSWSSIRSFFNSFNNEKYIIENDEEAIDVWVNRPITYVDIMQKMADSTFTPETGVKVNISVMPDAGKLILANSAGNTPDVALGLLSYMPFDLAIRGAAADLTQFDDYWEFADHFAPGALVPYILEDGVYAIPETLEFNALVYRKDVFNSLDIEVPDTWDDVIGILPTLQRYDMNFYYPTSGGTSLKWFYQTSPLIYQFGGTMYAEDGLSTTINSEDSVEGLSLLADLYTTYSLPEQVPVFYNSFRYNKLPVGIIDFNTYMQLKNAAPELIGQWEIAPYPGVVNEETGETERWYVGNGTGGMMFENSNQKEEAWEFMKWWMSTETQTEFAYTLQSTYGPEYLWLSGNIDAVENSPIDNADKQIIMEQIKWLRDVPRTPGQYMLERGLSDIWNEVTYDDVPIRVSIDRQVIIINREIERKMIEFGYLDTEGNILKPYTIRDVDWIQEQIDNAKVGDN
jgi:ABC-type glycerol-3-phosphate transport system substrate-binding protein